MPDKIIEVIGVGNVAFPDTMTDNAIAAVLRQKFPPQPKAQQQPQQQPWPGKLERAARSLIESPVGRAIETAAQIGSLATWIPNPVAQGIGRVSQLALAPFGAARVGRGLREGQPLEAAFGALEASPFAGRVVRGVRRATPTSAATKLLPANTATALEAERRAMAGATQEAADRLAGFRFNETAKPSPPKGRVVPRQTPTLEDELVSALRAAGRPELLPSISLAPPKFGPTPTPAQPRVTIAAQRSRAASEQFSELDQRAETALSQLRGITQPRNQPVPVASQTERLIPQVRVRDAQREFARQARGERQMTPGELQTMFGAEEAAGRFRSVGAAGVAPTTVRQATGVQGKEPLVKALRAMDERFRQLIDDPRGFAAAGPIIGSTVGAVAGGTAGASIPEDDAFNRFTNSVVGAIVGGTVGAVAPAAAGKMRGISGRTVEALDTANLLAGPAAVRASLGSLGGIATGMVERLAEGRAKDARAIWQFLNQQGPKTYWKALRSPSAAVQTSRVERSTNPALNVVLAPFRAADTVATQALMRGGYTKSEALNLLLTGEPTSQLGQRTSDLVRSNFVTRFLFKFPTVRIQSLERGIEFSPLRRVKDLSPRTLKGVRALSPRAARAREAIGIGAFAGGTAIGATMDPSFGTAATLSAAAGPAALPAGLGLATGRALRSARPLQALPREIGGELEFTAPTLREGDIRRILSGERFLPLRSLRRALGVF